MSCARAHDLRVRPIRAQYVDAVPLGDALAYVASVSRRPAAGA